MSQMPPQPPPPQQPYMPQYASPMPGKPAGLAVASMVLGIVSFLMCWVPMVGVWVSLIISILAIVFGVMAKKKANRGEGGGAGMAVTGLVLGIVWLSIFIIMVVIVGMVLGYGMWAAKKSGSTLEQELQKMQRDLEKNNPNGSSSLGVHISAVWNIITTLVLR